MLFCVWSVCCAASSICAACFASTGTSVLSYAQGSQVLPQGIFHEMKSAYAKDFVRAFYGRKYRDFSKHDSCSEKFRANGIVYLQRPQSNGYQQSDTYPLQFLKYADGFFQDINDLVFLGKLHFKNLLKKYPFAINCKRIF